MMLPVLGPAANPIIATTTIKSNPFATRTAHGTRRTSHDLHHTGVPTAAVVVLDALVVDNVDVSSPP